MCTIFTFAVKETEENVKGMMNVYKQSHTDGWGGYWCALRRNLRNANIKDTQTVNTSKGAGYHISVPKLRFAELTK